MQSFRDGLNPEQLVAATTTAQNCVVVAGAGTGKTKTLVARVCHLLEQGVPPNRILAVTFTRNSAAEIKTRVRAYLGDERSRIQAGTFHWWCAGIIRQSVGEGWTILDLDDQQDLMSLSRGERPRGFPPSKSMLSTYSYCRNSLLKLSEYLEKHSPLQAPYYSELVESFKRYESEKKRQRFLDFDDILALVGKALENPAYAQQLANGYDHILIDEMQDTNPLQWRVIQPLIGKLNLFCVGDDAQSIYAFRGSNFRFIHDFQTLVPGSQRLHLNQNYRSPTEILALSNWLLDQSHLDYKKSLWSDKPGDKPTYHTFQTGFEQAEFIAEKIAEDYSRRIPYADNLCMNRSFYAMRRLEASLTSRKIPYITRGGFGVFKAAHVKDMSSALRLCHNAADDIAWLRYLKIWRGVGDTAAASVLGTLSDVYSIQARLEAFDQQGAKFAPAVAGLRVILSAATGKVADLIELIAKVLDSELESRYRHEWPYRKADVGILKAIAADESSIANFLETYTLNPMHEAEVRSDGPKDAVTLSTVHSAKGLEADICYVLDAAPGGYPPGGTEDEEIEEERRVFYVALTRAKQELHLTRSAESGQSYGRRTKAPEFFLEKMPEDLVMWNRRAEAAPNTVQIKIDPTADVGFDI